MRTMRHLLAVSVLAMTLSALALASGASDAPKSTAPPSPPTSTAPTSGAPVSTVPVSTVPAPTPPPVEVPAGHEDTATPCEKCHTVDGWAPARFGHDRTGFPLEGAHQRAPCVSCHTVSFEQRLSTSCAGCHQDVHQQEFGLQCNGCHTETSWRPLFTVDAHRRTGFPLTGRHALLPCEECHQAKRDARYTRNARDCASCHEPDYQRASLLMLDHRRSGVSTDCRGCHQPTAFRPATYIPHEACFPLVRGAHRGIGCAQCHAQSGGLVADGRCDTGTADCRSCHTHQCDAMGPVHEGVAGYDCQSPKCIGCHTR